MSRYAKRRTLAVAPLATRFWSKVDKQGPVPSHRPDLGPCWLWLGRATRRGKRVAYGSINAGDGTRRRFRAHRVAFFLAHGRWPHPEACHHCDNGLCVNDAHLFEGTQADNTADRHAKDRDAHQRGEQSGSAKLTVAQVIEIRAASGLQREIGARYGVSQMLVSKIKARRVWGHLP